LRNLRRHLVFAFFAAAAWFPGAGFEAAWASAWLLPPGDGQIITYSAFSDSTRAFDGHGNLIPVPDYQKFELGTYVEYGVTDWLTVSAAPAYDRVQTPVPGQSYTGLGESEIAARVGLYHTDMAVLSVQAGLRSPGASFDSLGPLDVRRAGSLDVRGLAGHNCVVAGIEGFVEVQAGYRFYAENQPGEWRFDLTAGLRPLPRLLVMLQSFTSISFGTSQFGHVSWTLPIRFVANTMNR
jgi:protein XagA